MSATRIKAGVKKSEAQLDVIHEKIYRLRGYRVMLSPDLAELYGVQAKVLVQAVKRNQGRFPADFMFQLSWDETEILRSQIVTLKQGHHIKYRPYAFTEQGVAMLSSVLRSQRAVRVNIAIMRAFVQLREIFSTHKELAYKLQELEGKIDKHDGEIQAIFKAIQDLMTPPEKPKRRIGFHTED
ncbi:MAG: ORF6N domain-containing protein [Candidatus Omnitrophica bacterium]|nr:ORF6N domain-containing protein [Candidatus Omnitrophota bacterium]